MQTLFPPPKFEMLKAEVGNAYLTSFVIASSTVTLVVTASLSAALWMMSDSRGTTQKQSSFASVLG